MDGSQGPPPPTRRPEAHDRFVAFAFAGADMVAEIDRDGAITFAAGAFRSAFGEPAEAFVGRRIHALVAPSDHETLDQALVMLAARGRLLPMMIRMGDRTRSALALAGMVLGRPGQSDRLCLSFAKPPAPAASMLRGGSSQTLARRTEARMRAGDPCSVELLEVMSTGEGNAAPARAIEAALDGLGNGIACAVAPGRYGVLSSRGLDLASVAEMLEDALRARGFDTTVASKHLPVTADGLTPVQAARALRQALNVFARDGAAGLTKAGFAGGLAGYVRQAGASAGRLRHAIRDGQFAMAFQPVVSLEDGGVHHYEALIRPRPIDGCAFANPQEFVLMVESLGLADELDLAVAQHACAAAAQAGAAVAFNVSGQSAQSPGFRDRLFGLLAASPACRSGLMIVEMTETAEVDDTVEAARTAEGLRGLKVPFCLDDFGAGAADMRLLRALGADIVKLDGSYVPGVAAGGRERAFVAGMVEIARATGAAVVAERVEIAAEADVLRTLCVQYGQGWLFGRPGPLPARAAPRAAGRRRGATESWG